MPAYNFRKHWEGAITSGRKRQTIRKLRKDRRQPQVGEPFIAYVGMRTKGCRKLHEGVTRRVRHIRIEDQRLIVDGQLASFSEAQQIALADGFESLTAMLDYFEEMHGDEFEGHIVNWSDRD